MIKFKYIVFIYLLASLHTSARFDFSYASCSRNPFVALIAAESPEYPPHCLTGAIEQAHLTMGWERLMMLREQYRTLARSGQSYNNIQKAQLNQRLQAITQEIAKLSWVVTKIPNPHFVIYFHPFDRQLKQQIVNLWKARLKTREVTPQIVNYAMEIETIISLKYNLHIKKISPHAIDHQRYTFANCANDILLAFTAAVKAQDHPKCIEGALLRLRNKTMQSQPLPYFDPLPLHLKNRIEEFLKHRYYFKSVLPNLGQSALAKNQIGFGQNGFWMLGSEAIQLQNELESTEAYQLWYNTRFLTGGAV